MGAAILAAAPQPCALCLNLMGFEIPNLKNTPNRIRRSLV